VNGSHAYNAQGWGYSILAPEAGFSSGADFVFEVQPGDVDEGLRLEFESREFLVYYPDVVSVPLGLARDAAVTAAHQSVVVTSGALKAVA
jgi:hypothetical protein